MSQKLIAVELYNTETEEVEGFAQMSIGERKDRNDALRRVGDPHRWIEVSG